MIISERQSIFDISLIAYGSIEGIVSFAIDNNISITEDLTPGQILNVNENIPVDKNIKQFYNLHAIQPATTLTDEHLIEFTRIFDDTFDTTYN